MTSIESMISGIWSAASSPVRSIRYLTSGIRTKEIPASVSREGVSRGKSASDQIGLRRRSHEPPVMDASLVGFGPPGVSETVFECLASLIITHDVSDISNQLSQASTVSRTSPGDLVRYQPERTFSSRNELRQ